MPQDDIKVPSYLKKKMVNKKNTRTSMLPRDVEAAAAAEQSTAEPEEIPTRSRASTSIHFLTEGYLMKQGEPL